MSTPLTTAIQSLTTYANEVTGGSDTTLSAAVATLAEGYGNGLEPIYTVTLDAAIGSTLDAKNTIVNAFDKQSGHIYLSVIKGNLSSDQYAGICIFTYYKAVQYNTYVRDYNAVMNENSSYIFDVTAGASVNIYDISSLL